MCRKEKFLECPENPWRHFLELIRIYGRKKYTRGPTPCPRDRGHTPSPWARPLSRGPPGPPPTSTPTPYIHVRGEKNQREGFIAFYDMEPPPPPVLPREGRSGVRFGLQRGEIIAIIINHPPSPISWCSLPCMSNSIVGLLDGDGLDEIYHIIKLVLLGFDP